MKATNKDAVKKGYLGYRNHLLRLVVLVNCCLLLFSCEPIPIQIIDTKIPEEKLIISPHCIGKTLADGRIKPLACRDYDWSSMKYLTENYTYRFKENDLVVITSIKNQDEKITYRIRNGWLIEEE